MFSFIKRTLGIKTKVSSAEMAEICWAMCRRYSSALHKTLSDVSGESSEISVLTEEIIFNLWIISCAIAKEKKTLDILHKNIFIKRYCSTFSPISENYLKLLLQERYKEYYQTWRDLGQERKTLDSLVFCFLKNRNKENCKDSLNAMLTFQVAIHVTSTMTSILNLQKEYLIQDQ